VEEVVAHLQSESTGPADLPGGPKRQKKLPLIGEKV